MICESPKRYIRLTEQEELYGFWSVSVIGDGGGDGNFRMGSGSGVFDNGFGAGIDVMACGNKMYSGRQKIKNFKKLL